MQYTQRDILPIVSDEEYPKVAGLTTGSFLAYYNIKHARNGRPLTMLQERICLMPLCIYFRKNSYLTRPVNEKILKFINSGLITKWSKNFVDNKFLRPEKMKSFFHEPRRLTMQEICGAFQICGCLYLISFIVFLFEILYAYYW